MLVELLGHTARLRRSLRRLRGLALLGGGAALVVLPWLLRSPYTGASMLALMLALGYLMRKAYLFYRHHHALKQMRLEGQFLRLSLDPLGLQRCLTHREHLWAHSGIVQGLRLVLLRAPSQTTAAGPSAADYRRAYHRTFATTRPARISGDLLLLAGVAWAMAQVPPLAEGVAAIMVPAVLGCAVVCEGIRLGYQWQGHRSFLAFEALLSRWTEAYELPPLVRAHLDRTYIHRALYRARPWFASESAPLPLPHHLGDGHQGDGRAAEVPTLPPRVELLHPPRS